MFSIKYLVENGRISLDKPEHLDLINVKELGWTKYDNFQSSTDYIKFNENIIILLKLKKDIHLNYLEDHLHLNQLDQY